MMGLKLPLSGVREQRDGFFILFLIPFFPFLSSAIFNLGAVSGITSSVPFHNFNSLVGFGRKKRIKRIGIGKGEEET